MSASVVVPEFIATTVPAGISRWEVEGVEMDREEGRRGRITDYGLRITGPVRVSGLPVAFWDVAGGGAAGVRGTGWGAVRRL
ncbi:hypothetical protein BH23GEM8_BH23GEM8_13310 [soil metagenome]